MVTINYKTLGFFQKGHEFTKEIYKVTKDFPSDEKYGLTSQLKRAAASIGSNIAEGSVKSTADYKRFLTISLGSAKECEYQLLLAKNLDFISARTYDRLIDLLDVIIGSLTNYMKKI